MRVTYRDTILPLCARCEKHATKHAAGWVRPSLRVGGSPTSLDAILSCDLFASTPPSPHCWISAQPHAGTSRLRQVRSRAAHAAPLLISAVAGCAVDRILRA